MQVKENPNSPQYDDSQPLGSPPTRTYTRTFRVIADNATDAPQAVVDAVGVNKGDTYEYGTETDLGARCTSRRARRDSDSPLVWHVTIIYKAETQGGGGDNKEEDYEWTDDSFVVDQQVQWTSELVQEPAKKDKNGNAVKNAAKDEFDPPILFDKARLRLTISRNEPRFGEGKFTDTKAATYVARTNDANFWGHAAGKVLCVGITSSQTKVMNNDAWRVTYQFIVNDDGFALEPLEYGPNCLDANGNKKRCQDEYGHPISDRLAANGTQLGPDAALVAAADVFGGPFTMHDTADFAALGFDDEQGGVGIDI